MYRRRSRDEGTAEDGSNIKVPLVMSETAVKGGINSFG